MVKRLPEGESHATMLAYFCLMSLALTVVPAAVRWTPPSASQWLLLAGVGSLGVVSQAMIIRAYRSGAASFVAPFDSLKLLLAGLIGLSVLGAVPGPATLLGVVVLAGAAVSIPRRAVAPAPARTGRHRPPAAPFLELETTWLRT